MARCTQHLQLQVAGVTGCNVMARMFKAREMVTVVDTNLMDVLFFRHGRWMLYNLFVQSGSLNHVWAPRMFQGLFLNFIWQMWSQKGKLGLIIILIVLVIIIWVIVIILLRLMIVRILIISLWADPGSSAWILSGRSWISQLAPQTRSLSNPGACP